MKRRQLFCFRIGTALLFFTLAQSASADATFVVNDQSDAVDTNIGDGVCLATNGRCTLRAAIQEANAQYAAHPGTMYTISVPGAVTVFSNPRVYPLTLTGSGEDNAATGDLDIKCNLLLNTTNGRRALVNASGLGDRAFHIIQPTSAPINVTLVNVGFENGSVTARGGGMLIENAVSVTLTGLSVLTNTVTSQFAEGGGIDLQGGGTLTLNGVLVRGNHVTGGNNGSTRGGGIVVSGRLIVNNSTIDSNVLAENTATDNISGYGAGIDVQCCPGTLDISNSTISNNTISLGAAAQFITGGGINAGGTVTITGSTISGNTVSGTGSNSSVLEGGGLYVNGTMTMDTSTVTGNKVTATNQSLGMHGGGVVFNFHTQITNSSIDNNSVLVGSNNDPAGYGGGISVGGFFYNADLVLDRSVVQSNVANDGGGINIDGGTNASNDPTVAVRNSSIYYNLATNGSGIFNLGQLTVTNSTFYLNAASKSGGGLYNSKTATVNSTTFYANIADYDATNDGDGGGIFVAGGATQYLRNSLLTGEEDRTTTSAVFPDCVGTIISQDYNLIQQTPAPGGCNVIGTTAHNKIGTFPNVLSTTFQDNGGPTPTLELPPGSAAIDAGDDSVLGPPLNLAEDQRGYPRKVGAHVDIGALETGPLQTGTTFTVTNTAEHDDGNCTTDDCTLLEAINAANANADVSTINFAPGVSGVILNTLMPNGLSITNPVTINGPGASVLTISGNNVSRVFNVTTSGVVTFSGLTIARGSGNGGGGILNSSSGTVNVTNSTLSGSSVTSTGGGILNSSSGTVNVTNSTLSGNSASSSTGAGGGICNSSSGTVNVTNSTISGNSTGSSGGGGIFNGSGTLNVTNSTLSGNSTTGGGGGISSGSGGTGNIKSTIIALNTGASSPDVSGSFASQGFNLIDETDGSTGFTAATDQTGTIALPLDPKLDPVGLQNNGGPTQTIALLLGSPAVDKGKSFGLTTDQRGLSIFDDPGVPNAAGGDGRDIGAFELNGGQQVPTVLANISTRLLVETGNNVLIGGFIITGTQPKKVIVRAIGPSLSVFFTGVLADPVLELHGPGGFATITNDNWRSDQEAEIIATTIPPSNDLESAIVATLPANNSAYTAIVGGVNNGTGIGVVEAYDLDRTVDSKLANISTRGFVQTGDDVLIGGLIVLGQNPLRVIVRAIGPSLSLPGSLGDPTLELHDGNGALIAANDNWRSDQEAEIIATTIPPSNDLESAIVRNLTPGNYTAIVRGVNGTTGVALVEVYALN
jgi:CSLREA domain-containing protein